MGSLTEPPPPVRRIVLDETPTVVEAPAGSNGNGHARRAATARRQRAGVARERMRLERLTIAYGGQGRRRPGLAAGAPGRGARADRPLGLRQDDAAALAQPPHRADADGDRATGASRSTAQDVDALEVTQLRRRVSDGLPAAQPVPDERLRQRRLRAARGRAPSGRGRTELRRVRARRAAARRPARRGRATTSTARRCGSPAASSSGSASPARSPSRPEVLLLDEPCSALDPRSTEVIEELIVRAARARSRS